MGLVGEEQRAAEAAREIGLEVGDALRIDPFEALGARQAFSIPAGEKVFAEKEGLTKDGKSNLYTATLEEDVNGNIWLAQNSGLYKLDPRNNTMKLYGMEDGLVGNTFAIRASCKLQNGFLAFATTNGLAIFHPDSLKDNSNLPGMVFTDFQLSNQISALFSKNQSHLQRSPPQRPADCGALGIES